MVDIPEVPPGLSENLVEVEGDVVRVVKDGRKKRRGPVRVRANLTPLNVAAAAGLALVGVLGATIAWHGVSFPGPLGGQFTIFKGLKETTLGADINAWYERRKIREMQNEQDKLRADLEADDDTCKLLHQDFQRAARRGDFEAEADAVRKAKERGCKWSMTV